MTERNPSSRPVPPGDDDPTQVITGRPSAAPAPDDATIITAGGPTVPPSQTPTLAATSHTTSGGNEQAGLLPIGSRLAEFEVTRIVGQGGFGVVYEAWDPTLERVVAIKEYLPSSLSTRQGDGTVTPLSERHRETFDLGMRSFINEARLLAQFDHPSLLKVYRFWQERGTTYMVMPFYRGDTLRQALHAMPGGADEGWLLHIMDGVTQALSVMHAAHCYHRDIAPDNIILLEGSGRPVVLDFGAARRVITDKTQAITVILKPGYAPIEQYAEMPDMAQGAWTDVYALAAVMHVAVSGRAPPPSVARLLSDSYVPLSGNEALRQRYSPALLSAIDAGLGVRPESRPQSMAALRESLGLDGGVTVIRPPAAPSRASTRG
ncbi:MAG TPA: serine/threonine-protein kinase, partial [Variovorax sp.]|nr:serine/threonine-protein kinase [Variovorax sp.]